MESPALSMRERILYEALQLFVLSGYDGISMSDIAERCGITKAALYYHFVNKEQLILAVLNASLDELIQIVNQSRETSGGVEGQVRMLADLLFTRLPVDRRALIRTAGQEVDKLSPQAREEFGQRYHGLFIGGIAAMMDQGVQRGELRPVDPHLAAWILLGMMYPFFNPPQETRATPPNQIVDLIIQTFFTGMTAHD